MTLADTFTKSDSGPMKIIFFSSKPYEKTAFQEFSGHHQINYTPHHLNQDSAKLAQGYDAACVFVSDQLDKDCLNELKKASLKYILLRSAGFNHVDIKEAKRLGFRVARVPAYSPHAVAEHALALLMSLNRKVHRAFNRVREGNFNLDGLMGVDLHGKTVGIIGTGKIGEVFSKIMKGLGCEVLAYDKYNNKNCVALGVKYVTLNELYKNSDVISFHCPLNSETRHMLNTESLSLCKKGVIIINTGRGALIDTPSLINALKSEHVGAVGLDVYEEEEDLFFEDHSNEIIQDETFLRLLNFPNVLITGHQAFFTKEALANIAQTTLENANLFEKNLENPNEVN